MQSEATYLNILAIPATPRKQSESAIVFSMERERERIYLICFAHRHNNQIDNTHKKKSLVAKAREHRGTFRLSSRDTP